MLDFSFGIVRSSRCLGIVGQNRNTIFQGLGFSEMPIFVVWAFEGESAIRLVEKGGVDACYQGERTVFPIVKLDDKVRLWDLFMP